jgi:hypothetical protein
LEARNLQPTSTVEAEPKPTARSRLTNGCTLPGVDGRSTWVRRLRDLMALHLSDLGGEDAVSEAERSIVRRASVLTTELERLELKFARDGEASERDLDLYQRASNTLRRHLETVGLKRVAKDVTPTLDQVMARHAAEKAAQACKSAETVEATDVA